MDNYYQLVNERIDTLQMHHTLCIPEASLRFSQVQATIISFLKFHQMGLSFNLANPFLILQKNKLDWLVC